MSSQGLHPSPCWLGPNWMKYFQIDKDRLFVIIKGHSKKGGLMQ